MRPKLAVAALAAAALPAAAHAQAYSCAVPGTIARPRPELPTSSEPKRVVPIGGYTLAIRWAPEYCHDNGRAPAARFECRSGNRFGFTLHGLWPDGVGKAWPQYCRATTLLPPAVIKAHLCANPSVQLTQHEWAKHGTCTSDTPAQFLARSRALYGRLRYPDMDALSRRRDLTVGQFAAAFAKAYIPTLRSWSESTFAGALDPARPAAERAEIIDRFYDSYEQAVAKEPEGHGMDYVHCFMQIRKRA